ncbi:MAG TPA: hypothetical protein DEP53_13890, partial [Bacteroidetes bacterium]|nr:hypothetical protein [Bacteroidota bacterium]
RTTPLHEVIVEIEERQKRGRGRPSADGMGPMQTIFVLKFRIAEREQEVLRRRSEAGCFVLISNVPVEGDGALSGGELLKIYKSQNAVEMNFAFLKDPLIVNDLFLKTPRRIEALGMILIISVLSNCTVSDFPKVT